MSSRDPVFKSKIVSVSSLKSNRPSPIVANFQNGTFKRVDQMKVKRVETEDGEKKFALVATPDSVYKSDITDPDSSIANTFIAIRNKKTNEMRLVQFNEASFMHTLYESTHSIFESNIVDVKKVYLKEFGGKKAAASYDRAKRIAPNLEVLEQTLDLQLNSVDDKMFETDIFDQSQADREKTRSSIFPDIDLSSGNSVRDIFNPKKLLGVEMMEHLAEAAIQVLKTEPKDLGFTNNYLNSTIRSLQITKKPDSNENVQRVSIFIYIDSLIRLINSKKRTLNFADVSKISDQVARDVCKKFSMEGNFTNSKFTRQKSVIYYLILLLVSSENLEISMDFVLDGVDLTKTEVVKYATVIGAKIKNKNTLFIQKAKLDLDSKLSAPMPGRGKRRRN